MRKRRLIFGIFSPAYSYWMPYKWVIARVCPELMIPEAYRLGCRASFLRIQPDLCKFVLSATHLVTTAVNRNDIANIDIFVRFGSVPLWLIFCLIARFIKKNRNIAAIILPRYMMEFDDHAFDVNKYLPCYVDNILWHDIPVKHEAPINIHRSGCVTGSSSLVVVNVIKAFHRHRTIRRQSAHVIIMKICTTLSGSPLYLTMTSPYSMYVPLIGFNRHIGEYCI